MKKSVLVGMIAICMVLLMVNLSFAAIRTVCASGCGYTSIQAAVNAALPGDTIQVSIGTYWENVVVNTPGLIIQGADRYKTFVRVVSAGNAFEVTAPQVEISGFTVQGGLNWDNAGILITGFGGTAPVKKSPPRNVPFVPAANYGAYGVWVHDNIVEKSNVGIVVDNSSEVQVSSNIVRNNSNWSESCNGGIGILVLDDDSNMSHNIKLINNTLQDNDSYGLLVSEHVFWPNGYYPCGDDFAPVKEEAHASAPENCTGDFDGLFIQGNTFISNGSWDLWNPFDMNSAAVYFHNHDNLVSFVNNKFLATNEGGEFQGHIHPECWNWAGNKIFGQTFTILRGSVRTMPRYDD